MEDTACSYIWPLDGPTMKTNNLSNANRRLVCDAV